MEVVNVMKIDLTQTHDVQGAFEAVNWTDIATKYTDRGTKYCFAVLHGPVMAPYKIKLACFRHLRDLQRQDQHDFPYHYDIAELDRFLKFAAIVPEAKSNKPVVLTDSQVFIFSQLVAWKDKNNQKRYTRGILSMARHNGKSFLMGVYMAYTFLIASIGLKNQDYLISSINFKQTSKLMGYVKTTLSHIIQIEPFKSYAKECGIDPKSLSSQASQVRMRNSNNTIHAITYNSGSYDGFHFTLAIGDEFGKVADTQGVSDITTGQNGQDNHQFIQISTAYPDPSVPFHRDEVKAVEAMERDWDRTSGDNYLCLVWEQDSKEELFEPDKWVKSNPLIYCKPQMKKDLITDRGNALLTDSVDKFQNKSLNIWLEQSRDSFLKLDDVESAILEDFTIDNREVFIGFDYSMFSDNTAISFAFPYGDGKFHFMQHSFIPFQKAGSIEVKENQDGLPYRELAKKGYCDITEHPDGIINPEQVYKWLLQFVEDHHLQVVFFGYDRWGSFQVKQIVESLNVNTNWNIMDIQQTTLQLANPTKFLEEQFITHKSTINDDPIMKKALLNAVVKEDKVGIQIDKMKATLKIDVVDALIDALFQGMYYYDENADINSKETEVDRMTEQQVLDWFKNPNSGLGDD